MAKRNIDIWWDLTEKLLRDSAGTILSTDNYPHIHYTEKPLVRLCLVTDSALTPYTSMGGEGEIYSACIHDDFDHGAAQMCKTANANINKAGDWALADSTMGRFSIRLDADNAAYLAAIGTDEENTDTLFELKAFEGSISGSLTFATQFCFRCFNVLDNNGAVPA